MRLSDWLFLPIYMAIGLGFYAYILHGETGNLPSISSDFGVMVKVAMGSVLAGVGMRLGGQFLQRYLSWQRHMGWRFLSEMLFRMLLLCVLLWVLIWAIQPKLPLEEVNRLIGANQLLMHKVLVIATVGNVFLIIASFTFYTYHQFAVVQLQSVELRRRQLQVQFDMLQSQLSPHYLFNCLNTISNLVYKNSDLAEEFIRRFAQTYRYVLDTHREAVVRVSEEMEFVRAFTFLLQTRFGNSISLKVDLSPEALKTFIPPLTLQMLVENAVKHNMVSEESPLHITIASTESHIVVTNTVLPSPQQVSSFHVGLSNIRQRYEYFTIKPISIEKNSLFSVSLPLLHRAEGVTSI